MTNTKIDLENLMKEFGIDKMPEEQRNVVMSRLLQAVHIRMGLRMAEDLNEKDGQKVEKLFEQGDEKAVHEIEKIYPQFRQVYQEEVDRVRDEMRGLMPQ